MMDELNLENALIELPEKLNYLEQTNKQEFKRLAGLGLEALEHISEQEHFLRLINEMPKDFALAFCNFVMAVLSQNRAARHWNA